MRSVKLVRARESGVNRDRARGSGRRGGAKRKDEERKKEMRKKEETTEDLIHLTWAIREHIGHFV